MARGHRGRLDDRAHDPREGARRAVHHGRRDHLVRDRPRDRRRRRAAPARRAGSGLQRRLPAADQPGLRVLREPSRRVRGREGGERGTHVARRGAGVLPRAACRPRRARVARGAHGRRAAVHGVHGNGHDGERLLPALPRRDARARRRARAPDSAPRVRAARPRRARVRDPRPGGGDRRRCAARPARARRVSSDAASRPRSRGSAGCTGSWPPRRLPLSHSSSRRAACSAPTRPSASAHTTSARRCATCGGTSPSSRSTCSSSRSRRRSSSSPALARSTRGSRHSSRRRSS